MSGTGLCPGLLASGTTVRDSSLVLVHDIKGSCTNPVRSICPGRKWDLEKELIAHRATQCWAEELGSKDTEG